MEHTRVMGHDNYRPTRLHGMRSQQLHDGLTASMVKSGGGLVAHDDARLMSQRAGNRDALLLSTGQRRRQKIDAIDEPQFRQQNLRSLDRTPTTDAGGDQR